MRGNTTLSWIHVNGQPSVVIVREGAIIALAAVDASPEGIGQIFWVMNPTKLASIAVSLPTSGEDSE